MAYRRYSIEPYKRAGDDVGWTPRAEADAIGWFSIREKEGDHRCFRVFPCRKEASGR
jgi:hypothetical protein